MGFSMVGMISPALMVFSWTDLEQQVSSSHPSRNQVGADDDWRTRLLAGAESKSGSSKARLGRVGSDCGGALLGCLRVLRCLECGLRVDDAVGDGVGREGCGSRRRCLVVGGESALSSSLSSSSARLRVFIGLNGSMSERMVFRKGGNREGALYNYRKKKNRSPKMTQARTVSFRHQQ